MPRARPWIAPNLAPCALRPLDFHSPSHDCSPATDSAGHPQCDSRVQSGPRVPGDGGRLESAGAAAQRGRPRPKRRRSALTTDACQQRSAVAVGRASRAWLAVWSVAVRGRSLARARAHAAPHGRRAEAEVVARRARSAIATCQRVCPCASSGCTITYATVEPLAHRTAMSLRNV